MNINVKIIGIIEKNKTLLNITNFPKLKLLLKTLLYLIFKK